MNYTTLTKPLIDNYHFNDFLTVSPPKTAVSGGGLVITEKYSEKAFQNCLKNISAPKIKEDMTFSKNFNQKL